MRYFLAKTDPETYSIDDLEKDDVTEWDGVRNAQAVIFLKQMKLSDRVLIYHSQGQSSIVGLAEVVSEGKPDPFNEKSWLVEFKFIRRFSEPFITLTQVKETGQFKDFRLVRQARLSTMDVPSEFISYLKEQGLAL